MTTILDTHVQFSNCYNILLLILCLLGLILNFVMLVIFFTKRKVRHSAYTIYMVQIAVTDTAICLLWVVMTSMRLSDWTEFEEEVESDLTEIKPLDEAFIDETQSSFVVQRLFYAIYDFHYYNNIFLLAAMSVERSVAVMKSLRCQRYNFKKKFIYGVSALMWLLAFVCALPSFINPSLITENEQTETFDKNSNLSSNSRYHSLRKKIFDCNKPLLQAEEENSTLVKDCCGVHFRDCMNFFYEYTSKHIETLNSFYEDSQNNTDKENLSDLESDFLKSESENFNHTSDYDLLEEANSELVEIYGLLWKGTSDLVRYEIETVDLDDVCDPHLSYQAKVYQIIVNLILGFFIPYLAIVICNLFIAFVLRVRAKVRMENDPPDEEKLPRRRMSEFFRQFSHGLSRSNGEDYMKGSPLTRRGFKSGQSERFGKSPSPKLNAGYMLLESDSKKHPAPAPAKARSTNSAHFAKNSLLKRQDAKLRLSTQLRRTSRGSGSSAESFLTDVTSLHTSPSPNVRLSPPSFVQPQDGKGLFQRASSADSSGGSSSSRPTSTRRWSGEVFRTSATIDDGKKTFFDKKRKDETSPTSRESEKFQSTLSSRGDRCESTQALLGSQGRLPSSKFSQHNRSPSDDLSRMRAYSVASRTSTGAGMSSTLRPNIIHKHAIKQMRVSGIVLCFVTAFSICWLPQRIVTVLYVTEAMVGRKGYFCNVLTSVVRFISFFSVLLNPIVYTVTQREMRLSLRKAYARMCFCICKKTPQTSKVHTPKNGNGGTENKNLSGAVMNRLTTDELSRQERHARNRERWSRLVRRLGRPNGTVSGGFSTHEKQSDGTIDEEREDEKSPSLKSSKGQSSSNSFKIINVLNGLDDLKHINDMKNGHSGRSNGNAESIL